MEAKQLFDLHNSTIPVTAPERESELVRTQLEHAFLLAEAGKPEQAYEILEAKASEMPFDKDPLFVGSVARAPPPPPPPPPLGGASATPLRA